MIELKSNDYIQHLESIHRKLVFFLEAINNGNHDLIVDLALKLRILFMRKSGTEPLFTMIERSLNIELKVWVPETFEEELRRKGLDNLIDEFTFGYFNEIDFWLEIGNSKIGLIDAFNRPKAVKIINHIFSVKQIVEIVADKLGGAHIDPKLDERTLALQSRNISFGGLNISEHTIMQTTKQTIKIIDNLLDFIYTGNASELIEVKFDN